MRRRVDGRVVAAVAAVLCVLALIVGFAPPSRAAEGGGPPAALPIVTRGAIDA
ncbi:MAG: hypothetical protein ACJ73S_20810 [Mycobacteriales bacterium]